MSTAERPPHDGRGSPAAPAPAVAAPGGSDVSRGLDIARDVLSKYGALVAFAITVLVFSVLKPDTFATWDNWKDIFYGAAIAGVVAVGVTIPLVMNDFDLSFGAVIGLGGSVAVILVANQGLAWPIAVVVALLIGAAVGIVNGALVAYAGGPSFIITLAMLSVVAGIEVSQTDSVTIYQGIPTSFVELGQGEILGIRYPILIAVGVGLILWLLLSQSETGRYMQAVGGNPEAARLTGIRVKRLRLIGFVIAGTCAALGGVLLQAKAASSFPNSGTPFLLPVFAAIFLGAAMSPTQRFNIPGTLVGVVFLQVIQVGLIQHNLADWISQIVTGGVLIFAVLLSRLGHRA
jgi:ribose transport system permease protein